MVNQEHLRVLISADVKKLNAGLKSSSKSLKGFGNKLKSIGANLTRTLTLPLALAGGSAIKLATDFDSSMTKIKTLVGVAGHEVDKMKSSVIQLANQSGVSANEAADALFFITSAGLRGQEALSVLEASAKAAAIGLGETKTVADLTTSAINAYGIENLSAIKATDVLTAAVREGKLESTELAGAMGRVLPVASNMGISFDQVGAAFAAMSRTGTNANEAATQLRGILLALLKPTEQSKDMLASLNLSADGLRKSLREDGLLATLETLKTKFEGNDEASAAVFGNVRALTGVMDLLGSGVNTTRQIFSRMENTTGTLNNAFTELQKSSSFQLKKSLKELQNIFTELGGVILSSLVPIFSDLSKFVIKIFKSFNKLNPQTKKLIVVFTSLVATLPIVITAFGSILTVLGAIISPIGLVVAGVVLLATRFNEIRNIANDFAITIKTSLLNIFVKLKAQVSLFINNLGRLKAIFDELITNKFNADLDSVNKKFDEQADAIKKSRDNTVKYNNEVSDLIKANNNLKPTMEVLKDKLFNLGDGFSFVTKKTKEAKVELSNVFKPANFNVLPKVISQSTTWSGILSQITENTQKFNEVEDRRSKIQEKLNNAMSLGSELSNVLYQSFSNLAEGASFFEPIIRAIKSLITRLVAAAAAAAILAVLLPGGGKGKVLEATSFAGKFKEIFGKMGGIPFANGGIVSGPTLGLMGEYTGARSNPEVVAPLDRLNSMINNRGSNNVNVSGEFRLKGQDLVVALQRANKQRNRIL